MTAGISARTRLVALLGHPVAHSVSPDMHNAGFRAANPDNAYLAFDVHPSGLERAVRGLKALGAAGFNLTIPHKEAVLAWLDEADPFARMVGAVNTVAVRGGRLVGYNTDGPGFLASLAEEASFDPKGASALVIGAGGFARAVVFSLALAGASSIIVANRDLSRAAALCAEADASVAEPVCRALPLDSLPSVIGCLGENGVIINTTPVGMYPLTEGSPLDDFASAPPGTLVVDSIFNPLKTRFLTLAQGFGLRTVGGLGTLVHQGALAWEHWFGRPAPVGLMRAAALTALKSRGVVT